MNGKVKQVILLCLLIAIFILVIYSGISSYFRINRGYGNDFNVYYLASRNIIEGKAELLYTAHTERGERYKYLYPPLFAILMIPLCLLPLPITSILWFILNLLMYILSFLIIFKKKFKKEAMLFIAAAVGILTVAYFADNAFQGQVHILILFLTTLGWLFYKRSNKFLSCLFLAAAAVIKIIPGIFFLLLILKKEYKAMLYYVMWSLVLLIILPIFIFGISTTKMLLAFYYEQIIKPMFIEINDPTIMYNRTAEFKTYHDQDVYVAIKRFFGQNSTLPEAYRFLSVAELSDKIVKHISQFLYFMILFLSIIFSFKSIHHEKVINKTLHHAYADDLLFALFTVLSLLLSPRLRILYFPVLLFPYMILLSISFSDKYGKGYFAAKINYGIIVSFIVFSLLAFDIFRVLVFGLIGTCILFALILYTMHSLNKNNADIFV